MESVATIAAATAAATAAVPSAESAAAGRALFGLVDGQGPTSEVAAVQIADGAIGVLRAAHFDEAESARATGVAIGHELDLGDRAPALGEEIADLRFVRREREIADIQSGTHARTPGTLKVGRRPRVPAANPIRRVRHKRLSALTASAHHTFVSVREDADQNPRLE